MADQEHVIAAEVDLVIDGEIQSEITLQITRKQLLENPLVLDTFSAKALTNGETEMIMEIDKQDTDTIIMANPYFGLLSSKF